MLWTTVDSSRRVFWYVSTLHRRSPEPAGMARSLAVTPSVVFTQYPSRVTFSVWTPHSKQAVLLRSSVRTASTILVARSLYHVRGSDCVWLPSRGLHPRSRAGDLTKRLQRTFLKDASTKRNIPIHAIGLSLYESLPGTTAEQIGNEVIRTQWL